MLEFDGQPIDPAIVSAQPMKPAQNLEVPQMVCPPGMLYQRETVFILFVLSYVRSDNV